MNLGELCFVANENNLDIDIYDDYDERIACAYCGDEDFRLTEEGLKEFKDALDLEVSWNEETNDAVIHIPDAYSEDAERLVSIAHRFIYAAAGYCSDSDYCKWFGSSED